MTYNFKKIFNYINVKDFLLFYFVGLIFILLSKASINFSLFLSEFFLVLLKETLFLFFAFIFYRLFLSRIKNSLYLYSSYYFFSGVFGLFLMEYLINKNYSLGFFPIIFLFLLRAFEGSLAGVFISNSFARKIRENFLKNILIFYSVYASFSSLVYFSFSGKNIWALSFVFLLFALTAFFLFFLYRIKWPKTEKLEKPFNNDVTFY